MFTYIGLAVGDFSSGWLSQVLRSRTRVLRWFLSLTAACVAVYFLPWPRSLPAFYALCLALGFSTGYWAVFVTVAAEQFGTNLRATATTTVPNFVRGAVVPLTSIFQALAPVDRADLEWARGGPRHARAGICRRRPPRRDARPRPRFPGALRQAVGVWAAGGRADVRTTAQFGVRTRHNWRKGRGSGFVWTLIPLSSLERAKRVDWSSVGASRPPP